MIDINIENLTALRDLIGSKRYGYNFSRDTITTADPCGCTIAAARVLWPTEKNDATHLGYHELAQKLGIRSSAVHRLCYLPADKDGYEIDADNIDRSMAVAALQRLIDGDAVYYDHDDYTGER